MKIYVRVWVGNIKRIFIKLNASGRSMERNFLLNGNVSRPFFFDSNSLKSCSGSFVCYRWLWRRQVYPSAVYSFFMRDIFLFSEQSSGWVGNWIGMKDLFWIKANTIHWQINNKWGLELIDILTAPRNFLATSPHIDCIINNIKNCPKNSPERIPLHIFVCVCVRHANEQVKEDESRNKQSQRDSTHLYWSRLLSHKLWR